jgi:hypothetical protein
VDLILTVVFRALYIFCVQCGKVITSSKPSQSPDVVPGSGSSAATLQRVAAMLRQQHQGAPRGTKEQFMHARTPRSANAAAGREHKV